MTTGPPATTTVVLPDGYGQLLASIKHEVQTTQARLVRTTNTALVELYWRIGRHILARQTAQGWGARVIDQLSVDLRSAFPGQRGFSRTNLHYMRAFAEAWPDGEIVQQPVGQLPWGHITHLLDRVHQPDARNFYVRRAVTDGWSRAMLIDRIKAQLHQRDGAAPSNFADLIGRDHQEVTSRLATDPYRLDFLALPAGAQERNLEAALVGRVTEFLQQLGTGFAYLGRQHRLEIGDDEFFVDLLFYNTRLHRYIIFELKTGRFQPAHIGQLNLYINVIEAQLRGPGDDATIGILLVTDKADLTVRYTLAGITNPMAVATYTYNQLPPDVARQLPADAELAHALETATNDHIDGNARHG